MGLREQKVAQGFEALLETDELLGFWETRHGPRDPGVPVSQDQSTTVIFSDVMLWS